MSVLSLAVSTQFAQSSINIDTEIPLTGITGLFGPSGAGKTSLLKGIAGINKHIAGRIVLASDVLLDSSNHINLAPEERNVVGVFQQDGLFPHLSVKDNLVFALKRSKNPKFGLNEVAEKTNILHLIERDTNTLSGGERQRVAIARALLAAPKLLILDEPVTALDKENKATILSLIKSVQQAFKLPMLYVSHNLEELQALADHLIVIEQGTIAAQGSTHQVIHLLNKSQLIEPQTSLTTTLADEPKDYGLLALNVNQKTKLYAVEASFACSPEQKMYRCYILARDISISTQPPTESSIVNQLAGTITHIEVSNHQVLLTIDADGQNFYSSISLFSLHKLKLVVGKAVYLQFKASAIRQLIS